MIHISYVWFGLIVVGAAAIGFVAGTAANARGRAAWDRLSAIEQHRRTAER